MKSIWQEEVKLPSFDRLEGDISTEVAIVGGGIAGVLVAYMLKKENVPCVVLEKERIGQKTTAHTTGKITAQHGLIYDKIIRRYGKEFAEGYYLANTYALEKYREISAEADCDFEIRDNYVYSTKNRAMLENEMRALEKINVPALLYDSIDLPLETKGAVSFKNQAQFHPLKFLSHIARDLEIYEHTHVTKIEDGMLFFDKGRVKAQKIVVATHFPIIKGRGLYFLKMYQHRSYVLGLKGASMALGMYVDEDKSGLSFRDYKNYLLLGGGGRRTGKKDGGMPALKSIKDEIYPEARVDYSYAAEDCITLDGMPYIGKYSSKKSEILVATGFNKWGMSGAMLSAELLLDGIRGTKNDFSEIFSPQRRILHPELLTNIFESTKNLLTPTAPRCTHLGCALKWNKDEHTWDCPCHGSRFADDGRLLEGPANRDLK